jgi:ABC transporter with metal-binding/Fe-S-binding domain ATP-binding protein
MRLAVLFSGGKDSTLALMKTMEKHEVVCLVSVISRDLESYMFHTVNIGITRLQAKSIGLPLILEKTEGRKEEELEDLRKAIMKAIERFKIEGVVTGAIESAYQSGRVQRICSELGLCCVNPLWKRNQKELLEEILDKNIEVLIVGVFAYPLDRSWLGKIIDSKLIAKLANLQEEYGISPAGEGGELETTVLDAPIFKLKIEVLESEIDARGNSGVFIIKKARLTAK